ncbi:MAG TPA: hypothetical protein VIT85_07700 [Solirubrobacterales bacterium]
MRRSLAAVALAAALALAGCGSGSEDETPVACLEGANAYVAALADAPTHMKLSGEVPISDCLVENQKAGDLARVGTAMLKAATVLNARAREDPGGTANFELGFLVGKATAGAEDTQGIHAELLRRLESAARYAPAGERLPAVFLETFQQGFNAGAERG